MLSIIDKVTHQVVVASIRPSELENAPNERFFILQHIPRNLINDGSLDLEASKYEIVLNITNFKDPLVQGAIRGYLEGSKVLRDRDDDEFLHASNPMGPPQLMFGAGAANTQVQGPDSQVHSSPKFRGTPSPSQMASGRVEESKHQGGVRLNKRDGEVLKRQDHAMKSTRDKASISKEVKTERKTRETKGRSNSRKMKVVEEKNDNSP
jgi:hypothetical protein